MFYQVAFALSSALAVQGHVALTFPPPFNAAYNPSTPQANVDYSITSPLSSDGSNYPCKIAGGGVLSPTDPGGESQVTWLQGEAANFTTGSGAIHAGGSCQASLSFDQGKTWKVIHSYIGDCPTGPDQKYDVAIPSDAPTGPAIFQWSWVNRVGNREFYANCAAITIAGANGKRDAPVVPFDGRPAPFTANIGNGCQTVEGKDVDFPNPGPDVTRKSQDGAASISGNCGAVQAPPDVAGGSTGDATTTTTTTTEATSTTAISQSSETPSGTESSASESGVSSGQCVGTCRGSAGVTSPLPDAGLKGELPTNSSSIIETSTTQSVSTSRVSTSAIAMASSVVGPQSPPTAPSAIPSTSISRPAPVSVLNKNLVTSPDGTCSLNSYTCTGYAKGSCCSQFGYCGSSPGHCGEGCQAGFGSCSGSASAQASNSTISSLRENLTSAATSVTPNTSTTTLVALSATALSLLSTLTTLATMATSASDGARGVAAPTTACAPYSDEVASDQRSTKTDSTTEGIAAVTPIVSVQARGFRGRLRT